MDQFINLAKKGYDAYQESQSNHDVKKTGGHEFNSPDNTAHNSSMEPEIDRDEAVRQSAEHHGSGETSIFETAMSFLDNHKEKRTEPIDEEHVTRAHHEAYNGGGAGGLSASALGGAAALETLKKFNSGHGSGGSASGGSQTKLVSMAMAEAAKLFDKKQPTSGNKQDAVNGAAMTAMKLLVQSKVSGAVGGSNSGGLSGLLSLASKFSK